MNEIEAAPFVDMLPRDDDNHVRRTVVHSAERKSFFGAAVRRHLPVSSTPPYPACRARLGA